MRNQEEPEARTFWGCPQLAACPVVSSRWTSGCWGPRSFAGSRCSSLGRATRTGEENGHGSATPETARGTQANAGCIYIYIYVYTDRVSLFDFPKTGLNPGSPFWGKCTTPGFTSVLVKKWNPVRGYIPFTWWLVASSYFFSH